MCNVIRRIMDERGLKPTPFARSIGVKTSTMFSIYRGEVSVDRILIDNYMRIAHGLGMTADELRAYEDTSVVPSLNRGGYVLSEDEESLIDAYRAIDEAARRRVMRVVMGELDDMEEASLKNAAGA